MDPSPKILLVIIFAAVLHFCAFSQSDTSGLSFFNLAEPHLKKDQARAFAMLEKALTISRKKNNKPLYIKTLNKLASLDLERKDNLKHKIFAWLQEAAPLLNDEEKTSDLALLHYNLGSFYYVHRHNIDSSLYHFEAARNIWQELNGNWDEQIANCYHGIGDVYKYLKSDFLDAEKLYEKALHIREAIGLGDTITLYRIHYNLATTNRSQRDFEKALSYGTKALEIAKKMEGPIYQEMTHGVVAGIYRDMGESKMAKEHYATAIILNRKTDDPKKALGWYYQGLGETLKNDSLYDDAIKNFRVAYDLYQRDNASSRLVTYLLQLMADTYALMGKDLEFQTTVRILLNMYRELGMMHGRQASETYLFIGNYHYRKNQIDSALQYYQQALIAASPSFLPRNIGENPTEEMIGFNYFVHSALSKKASAFRKKFTATNDTRFWLNAFNCFRLAERILSLERNTLDMQDAQWDFLDRNYDIYEDIISLLFEEDSPLPQDTLYALAFQYFEQSKSRTLADALVAAERTSQIGLQDTLFNRHAQLKRELLKAQDKLNKELENENRPEVVTNLRDEIVNVDRKIQNCKVEIEKKFPGYFNVKYGYQPPSLENMRKTLAGDNRVIIEYFWGRDWVYALGISENQQLFYRIGRPHIVGALIDSLLLHFEDGSITTRLKDFNRFTASAYSLYDHLIKPFEKILTSGQRLQVNPDGPVSKVPFEILLEEESSRDIVDYRNLKFMVKSYPIAYAYSASTLVNRTSRSIRNPSFLAVGNAPADRRNVVRTAEIGRRELDLLSNLFSNGKFLTGNDATESNFKRLSPDFDIIHLAIHGSGDVNKDFSARLYFSAEGDEIDDGQLHAYELYGLKLNAAMAVLTACESGLGKGYKGEGMMSMASAFTYSGCENILMSLWKLNDQASNFLMEDFYAQLRDGIPVDQALRSAKLKYLENSDELSADPKIWAPLVAYGNAGQIFRPSPGYDYIIFGAVLVLAVIAISLLRKRP